MADKDWQQIESIFDKVIELPAGERDAYLTDACAGNAELRSQIEKLLDADEKAADFISSPVFASTSIIAQPHDIHESASPSSVGRKIGSYRLIKEIGRGGMGTVFLAERDDSEFQKRVAVKLIKRGMDTDFVLKRFRNERQILATLEHPNIARLLDGGTTDDDLPFFVMEYIEGESIKKFCDSKSYSTNERLHIFLQVCAAVGYAHLNSVLHRDLKPGNILVTTDGAPKLLDFGIAKLLDPELALHTIEPTLSLLRLMTPEYASPEQVRGDELTPASDIYSLGVLLYELLTGKRPYQFPSKAPHEITRVICEEPPLSPSDSGAESGPFDADLDNIILKTLSKSPDDRYSSVEEFSSDIRNFLGGLPVSAPSQTSTKVLAERQTGELAYQTAGHRFLGSGRNLFALSAMVILIAAIAYFGVYPLLYRNTTKKPGGEIDSIAVLPFINVSGDPNMEYLSDGIAESLINSLSQLKGIKVIARSSVFRYKGLEAEPQTVAREMNVRAVLTGKISQIGDTLVISAELVDTLDNRHLWGEQYNQKAKDLVSIQEDIARQMSRKLQTTLTQAEEQYVINAHTQNPAAYQAYLKGRFYWNKRTAEANNTAIDHLQQAVILDPDFALAYTGIADCYIVAFGYQFMPAGQALDKAEEAVQHALNLDAKSGEAHAAHAYIEGFGFGHYEEAGREFTTAVDLSPNYATAHQWFSMYLAAMGKSVEAIREVNLAITLDPVSLIINADAVLVYYYTGKYDLAMAQCQKVRELDPQFWVIHIYEGLIYEAIGKNAEAIESWETVLKANPKDRSVIASLGHVYGETHRRQDALRMLNELRKQAEPTTDVSEEEVWIYAGMAQKNEAFASLENAIRNKRRLSIFFKADPRFNNLHTDPRFAALMAKAGFPE